MSDSIRILKFTASWCSPCRQLQPILKLVSERFHVPVQEYDIDDSDAQIQQYQIKSVPTLIFTRNGIEYNRCTGLKTEIELKELLGLAI